jgi:hypothetical protein
MIIAFKTNRKRAIILRGNDREAIQQVSLSIDRLPQDELNVMFKDKDEIITDVVGMGEEYDLIKGNAMPIPTHLNKASQPEVNAEMENEHLNVKNQQPLDTNVTDNTIGMWFLPLNDYSDWFGILQKKTPAECSLVCRFRYDPDNDSGPHENNDRRSWYTVIIPHPPAESIEAVRSLIESMREKCGITDTYDEVLNSGDFAGFADDFLSRSWANARPMDEDE